MSDVNDDRWSGPVSEDPMSWTFKLIRVRGIDIKIHLTFLLILALGGFEWGRVHGAAGFAFGVLMMLALFACVTLHELGHSVAAQHYRIPVREIVLLPIGGVAMLGKLPEKPQQELGIAADRQKDEEPGIKFFLPHFYLGDTHVIMLKVRVPAGKGERQVATVHVKYKDLVLDDDFRIDLIVDGKVIVELKVVKELAPIHEAQLLTYMKLTNCRVGLLINFNVVKLKDGIKRMVL